MVMIMVIVMLMVIVMVMPFSTKSKRLRLKPTFCILNKPVIEGGARAHQQYLKRRRYRAGHDAHEGGQSLCW